MEYVFSISIPFSVWLFLAVLVIIFLAILLIFVTPIVTFTIRLSKDKLITSSMILYSFTVNKDDVKNISIVDLKQHPELKPLVRTFGHGLPGYELGWFKLSNGAKAFLAVSGSDNKAVVIELRDGTYVILIPKNIDEFIDKLRESNWVP